MMWQKVVMTSLVLGLGAVVSANGRRETATTGQYRVGAGGRIPSGPPGHERMLDLLKEIAARTPDENPFVGDRRVRLSRARLEALPTDAPDILRLEHYARVGEAELAAGFLAQAIEHLSQAYQLLPAVREELTPGWGDRLIFRLGVAHLLLGETRNCRVSHSPDACILPIREGGIHAEPRGSETAIKYFTEVVQRTPTQSEPHLASQWLLNIAYMTLGAYPEGVPMDYRIPPAALASKFPLPRFANIARRLGIATFSLAGGAVGDDFDNDGNLDLLVSTWDPAGQIRFFRNMDGKVFRDSTEVAGLEGLTGGLNMVQADYDNDGDIDVLVLRGAWLGRNGRHPNSLLRNNGDGTFTDVTFEAGLGDVHYPTQTASWADYDNDGQLDLYIGNETRDGFIAPSQLFHNNGDATFTDLARQAGVTNLRFAKAVVWGDYDGDGRPDIYVSNLGDINRLYHNNGDGTFTDVAERLAVTDPKRSFPAWFWDVDNDGALDLYVSAYDANIADLAASYLGRPFDKELARLYLGDGRGGFRDAALEWGLTRPNAPMGANFGDLDNDGYLDFYLGTGYPDYHNVMPNVMYLNDGGRRFTEVTTAGGFGHLQKGHAIVFFDFDGDGDQDVFEQMGGSLRGDGFYDVLYENPGSRNHWIELALVGIRSPRSPVGARLRLSVKEDRRTRQVYKYVNSGGSFGANPLRLMIGLGEAEAIERLEVYWPTTGRVQSFERVALDQSVLIVEGDEVLLTLRAARP